LSPVRCPPTHLAAGVAGESESLIGAPVAAVTLIRGAIPPGSNSPPAEVFGVIEAALRAHFARQIEP
jgi:hypothetical protein